MEFKRIYVRVPLSGEAILSNSSNPTIKAHTINISRGGVAVETISKEIPTAEYQIEIHTDSGQKIEIFAKLIRVDDSIAGFRALQIDQNSQEIIKNLVFEYETTNDFINNLDEFNLRDQEGNKIEITFEKNSNDKQ
ncbi:MAG: PilZ domain-containing protein [Proteobacteria bacterium]|jgi:c-di-GMP-binding flagellar brake protein YcgR|nr:PilZ domain-containing protein [Desulfocapsa sp.]MBU3944990.1 PilZ domain-containing protein [Pseudomonadota bacterium]MCG2744578.1 PilZ domain-containing protein [Desulfobacteraceae bacterium]MBU4028498.1 PilZ domain-containing protein [Pseudomonadota bacterium]MBU4041637.1 PilZ domain-containing protein [Pseudomonadota bacterium]